MKKMIIVFFTFLLSLVLCLGLLLSSRSKGIGLPCIFDHSLKYKMTMPEVKSILGEPESEESRSDGSIVLQYNILTSYGALAEAKFAFSEYNCNLYSVSARIHLNKDDEAAALHQRIRDDLIGMYGKSAFFFDKYGSLDGEVIGVDYFGIRTNAIELVIENGTTILLSGWLS